MEGHSAIEKHVHDETTIRRNKKRENASSDPAQPTAAVTPVGTAAGIKWVGSWIGGWVGEWTIGLTSAKAMWDRQVGGKTKRTKNKLVCDHRTVSRDKQQPWKKHYMYVDA